MRKTEQRLRDAFIGTARSQIGYRSVPGVGTSTFGSWAGYPQGRWDGALLDWCAAQHEIDMPRMTDTVSALSEYIKTGRLYQKPRVGDIAFLPAATPFGQPQVGVVRRVEGDSTAYVIRGQVANPQPRANQDPIGVYETAEFWPYIIGYGRPQYKLYRTVKDMAPVTIRTSDVQIGRKNAKVTTVQTALGVTVGATDLHRGEFDRRTAAWYAKWQWQCGLIAADATGQPDALSLERLAHRTGLFTYKEL